MSAVTAFDDLEAKVSSGGRLSRTEVARVLASPDLISVGMLGETARKRVSGEVVTFGRVCELAAGSETASRAEAGEVRLTGAPSSADDACERARAARALAGDLPVTGFSAADLVSFCGHDHLALADLAARLRDAGLEAVAECPLDRFGSTEEAVEIVRAIAHGGLGVWRFTVDLAPLDRRLDMAERAAAIQAETGAARAFAPLPRQDSHEVPSTGYDDVRTVAMARLTCHEISAIQVDWPLYGPKLAQVALAYGANDIDGVAAADSMDLGPRRSPKEEILRQIRAAACVPVERNGRFERRS